METWTWRALAGAAVAVLAVAIGIRLSGVGRPPAAPPRGSGELLPGEPAVVELMEAEARIARDVIAGRRSLLEAAAAYKALDDRGPPCPGWRTVGPPPDVSPEEYYCRMTIDWARNVGPSDEVEDRARVLEAEMADRLPDGTLRLPDP